MLTKQQKAWIQAHVAPTTVNLRGKGPTFGEIFVAIPHGFLCQTCTRLYNQDVTDDEVEVWQVGSEGWTGPCVCSSCSLSIPVIVNGKEG